jgi:hypothetical protein
MYVLILRPKEAILFTSTKPFLRGQRPPSSL